MSSDLRGESQAKIRPLTVDPAVVFDLCIGSQLAEFLKIVRAHGIEFFSEDPAQSQGSSGVNRHDNWFCVSDENIRLNIREQEIGQPALEACLKVPDLE